MRLHLSYKNVHKGAIRAADKLFEGEPWGGTPGEIQARLQAWLNAASDAYSVPRVTLALRPASEMGFRGGAYSYEEDGILLTSPSALALFHQFRHHLQACGRVELSGHVHPEYDAQGWACSLYYNADPTSFRRLVYEGGVVGMDAEDLEAVMPTCEAVELSDDETRIFEDLCDGIVESLSADEGFAQLMEEIAREDGS